MATEANDEAFVRCAAGPTLGDSDDFLEAYERLEWYAAGPVSMESYCGYEV